MTSSIVIAADFLINESINQNQHQRIFAEEFYLANWDFTTNEFPIDQEIFFRETFQRVITSGNDNNIIDMLSGAIYYGNPYATEFLLDSYDFTKFLDDPSFVDLLMQSIYQMEFFKSPNVYITKDLLVDYFITLFPDNDEIEEIDYDY